MVTRAIAPSRADSLLRRAIQGNSVFSTISGVLLAVYSGPIDTLLGLGSPIALTILGGLILVGAALLAWVALQPTIDRGSARAIVALDVTWVIASALLLVTGVLNLSVAGDWVIGGVGIVVGDFALLEYFGLRRVNHC
jgi:hypothetical protein